MDVLSILNKYEARGISFLPQVIWDKAYGNTVVDKDGKEYIDFSSGVMITNTGHANEYIKKAIVNHMETHGFLTSYMFPCDAKAKFLQHFSAYIPKEYKVALFSTGSESADMAIKLSRLWNSKYKPGSKSLIISFTNSFHGRTLGAQTIGGQDILRDWIPEEVTNQIVKFVPFPDKIYSQGTSFDIFTNSIKQQNIATKDIAAVIIECYQGCVGSFAPNEYMEALSQWCKHNDILLIVDEIQSGFGRTGKFWAYQHYNICPDIILAGKGISSSLPLSAIIARADVIDNCPMGLLGTTHSGNTLCCVAAKANLEFIEDNNLVTKTQILGDLFLNLLESIADEFPSKVRGVYGRGLVAALHLGNKTSLNGNSELANRFMDKCIEHGLIIYTPCGPDIANIKLVPPLTISETDLVKGCQIIRTVLSEL